MSTVDDLRYRLAAIEQLAEQTYGTNEIEHLLVDLLRFLESHPESRHDFEEVMRTFLLRNSAGAYETIGFTMRTLRWAAMEQCVSEVRDHAQDLSAARAEMWRSNYDRLLSAFADEWDDSDLYDYYRDSTDDATRND